MRSDRLRITSFALLAWSLLYAVPHLYWAWAGPRAIPSINPRHRSRTSGKWRTCSRSHISITGTLGFVLRPAWNHRLSRLVVLTIVGGGGAIAMAHGLYGIAFRAASVAGLTDIEGVPFDAAMHGCVLWDLLAIEPWFLVEGVLLALVGYFAHSSAQGRRRWVLTVSMAFAVFLATAALGLSVA